MPRTVRASINYLAAMSERPRYHAQDHSRDNLVLDPREVDIEDLRGAGSSLAVEGFALVPHPSAVADFRDEAEVARLHGAEIEDLLRRETGADHVVVTGKGILRFAERSPLSGKLFNSLPARFIHIDISDPTAREFAERSRPEGRQVRRFAHYNVWRVITPPPQDVPLALCDARSLAPEDLVTADAVFDAPGGAPEWSFEGLLLRYDPRHRWCYFSGMTRDEALIFKTNDGDPGAPHHVPHSAFDDPSCPPGVVPRGSVEMRAVAYWLG
ncbi:MAG: CmcJ/NvfI family oxidoreductase [Rhizomicrobium sp.]